MKVSSRVAGPIAAIVAMAGVVVWLFWPFFVALLASDPACGSIAIKDVCKAETLRLGGNLGFSHTHRLTVRVTGQINGTAIITNPLAYPGPTETVIAGSVDQEWSGDHYTDTAEIRFAPRDVRSGSLTVEYEFHCTPSLSPSN
jgi:hypothetical protein